MKDFSGTEGVAMKYKSFSKTFSSELYNVKYAVIEIMDFFIHVMPDLSDDDLYDLKLVFSELLINAVIHGNQNDNSKLVKFDIFILEDGTVSARIIDEGLGFDYIKLLNKNNTCCSMDENGRGICLVYSLTDQVFFNTLGNEIKFTKKVRVRG